MSHLVAGSPGNAALDRVTPTQWMHNVGNGRDCSFLRRHALGEPHWDRPSFWGLSGLRSSLLRRCPATQVRYAT